MPRFKPLVLCYHGISEDWEDPMGVRPRMFESHLRLFLRIATPAAIQDTLDGRQRLLHVTFDDAYANVVAAVPILERLGVPATVFACSAYADGGRPLAIPELLVEARWRPDELTTMSWDDLRDLAERGVEVGSHTVSHAHLPLLTARELAYELRQSKEQLEAQLQKPCRVLAYPYGEHDGRVRAAARAAGYEAAFALPGDRRTTDPYALPRIPVWRSDGVIRTAAKASHFIRSLHRAGGLPDRR